MHNLLFLERSLPLEETDVVNGLIGFGIQVFKKLWFTRRDKTDVVKGLMWFTHFEKITSKKNKKYTRMGRGLKSRFWRNRARDLRTIDN